jgi:acetyltransferase
MAIVAEVAHDGAPRLAGVGRLVADPDHRSAEFAVLVTDEWQNRGLGTLLTGYCLEIAAKWGVERVTAETTPDNARMLSVFQGAGFKVEAAESDLVRLAREIDA